MGGEVARKSLGSHFGLFPSTAPTRKINKFSETVCETQSMGNAKV